MEEIDDGINKEVKNQTLHAWCNGEKMFDDKYLPAMITFMRWISNMQFFQMMLEQTSCIFEQLHKDKG